MEKRAILSVQAVLLIAGSIANKHAVLSSCRVTGIALKADVSIPIEP